MKAVQFSRTGGAEVLELVDLPPPSPGPREVVVAVEAAGVNFIDVYQRAGVYPEDRMPARLGLEGAGTVRAVGEGVSELAVGDRVAWAGVNGSYAELLAAPVDKLVPLPATVSSRDAAAVMLQGMTAHYLVRSTFPLAAGMTCLVHAAAGGVGLLLCSMAKRLGARVIGTVGDEAKAARAKSAGADEIILYASEDVAQRARALTGGAGVDVVYDSVGQATFEGSLASLRRRGMLVSFGQSSGKVPPFAPLLLSQKGSLFITRPTLKDYTATRAELLERAGDVLAMVSRGELTITVHESFPLDRVADAHRLLESRATIGKVLLVL
jgi:NADPH2:quinone reductase